MARDSCAHFADRQAETLNGICSKLLSRECEGDRVGVRKPLWLKGGQEGGGAGDLVV